SGRRSASRPPDRCESAAHRGAIAPDRGTSPGRWHRTAGETEAFSCLSRTDRVEEGAAYRTPPRPGLRHHRACGIAAIGQRLVSNRQDPGVVELMAHDLAAGHSEHV